MKIYAPVTDFNGWRNNIQFVNGVGETDNPQKIEWFKNHGYKLENGDYGHENVIETPQLYHFTENDIVESSNDEIEMMGYPQQSLEEMTPNELRQWAIEHGFGSKIRNTRNKEKLLEILRG